MPKAFLFTNKRYDLYNLNIPRIWCKNEKDNDEDNQRREEDSKHAKFTTVKVPLVHQQRFRSNRSVPERRCFNDIPSNNQDSVDKSWTLVISENGDAIPLQVEEDEQPVNLSTKKIDLFNLTQLAEVSLARANSVEPKTRIFEDGISKEEAEVEAYQKKESRVVERLGESGKSGDSSTNNPSSVPVHSCVECGKGFSTLSNLARHRQTHRSPTDAANSKKCTHCDKVYVSIPAFSMHLRTHNQGCKCQYCGKAFSRPWLLQGHIRTHTGEKPFRCDVCGKAFADKSNLRAHTQTHSTEKPFKCTRCGKNFALKSYLCKHIESSCMKSIRGVGGSKSSLDDNHNDSSSNTGSDCSISPNSGLRAA